MTDQHTPVAGDSNSAAGAGFASDEWGGLTAGQLSTLANDALSRGQMSRDEANAMLAADNLPPLEDSQIGGPKNQAASELSDKQAEVLEFDKQNPPGRPEDFQVPNLVPPGGVMSNAEVTAVAQKIQGWCATARLPKEIGNSILREADRVSATFGKMSESQKQDYTASERAKLARLWGDQTDSKIRLASQLVYELEAKSPGIVHAMTVTGAGSSALVMSHLVSAAERLLARQGG